MTIANKTTNGPIVPNKTTKVAPAPKAPVASKAQTSKAPIAPKASKAPAIKVAPAPVQALDVPTLVSEIRPLILDAVNPLANMVRTLELRVAELETSASIYLDTFERFERIVVAMQTAQLQAPVAPAPVQQALEVVQAPTAPAPVPALAPMQVMGLDAVITQSALYVHENAGAGYFNEKVQPQSDCDYRVYLKTPQHKTFKVAIKDAGLTLRQGVDLLETAVKA
jgi:hypothetical protein